MTCADDDAERSDEVGHTRLRGRVALMTCADDDAERSDEEEWR
ncbi:hypothetical protein RN08_0545 [Mycobacterium tuberculosis variant microti]|nr:hypothetical protein RN08_0545 [Mycobacterium tuberculosis variant microti]